MPARPRIVQHARNWKTRPTARRRSLAASGVVSNASEKLTRVFLVLISAKRNAPCLTEIALGVAIPVPHLEHVTIVRRSCPTLIVRCQLMAVNGVATDVRPTIPVPDAKTSRLLLNAISRYQIARGAVVLPAFLSVASAWPANCWTTSHVLHPLGHAHGAATDALLRAVRNALNSPRKPTALFLFGHALGAVTTAKMEQPAPRARV
jgi:hypothetical protein